MLVTSDEGDIRAAVEGGVGATYRDCPWEDDDGRLGKFLRKQFFLDRTMDDDRIGGLEYL